MWSKTEILEKTFRESLRTTRAEAAALRKTLEEAEAATRVEAESLERAQKKREEDLAKLNATHSSDFAQIKSQIGENGEWFSTFVFRETNCEHLIS